MEIFFCHIPLAALFATMLVGAFISFLSFVYDYRQQKKEIEFLEKDNLQLTRRNEALRELLYSKEA